MLRETQSATRQLDSNTVNWSARDMKAACFQDTNVCDTKEIDTALSTDWTEYQEDQARPKTWKSHKELLQIKRSFCRRAKKHNLQEPLADRRSKDIQAQTDHSRRIGCACRRWCFFAHDGRKFSLLRKRKPCDRPQNTL